MSLITEARGIITRAMQLGNGGLLVFLSGGKDSLTILDLAVGVGARVECLYMYMVDGLRCVEDPIQRALARYPGVKLHKMPDWRLSSAICYGEMCVARKVRILRLADIERAIRAKTGIDWVASGERSNDSFTRTQYVGKVQGFNEKSRHIFPIWNWKTADVVSYLRARKIPLPEKIGAERGTTEVGTSAFSLQPECLRWLYHHHPEDFARVEKVFPYVGAVIARDRYQAAAAK